MNISFLSGPARYEPRGPWRPIWALLAVVLITLVGLVLALVTGVLAEILMNGLPAGEFDFEEALASGGPLIAISVLVTQIVTIVGVWLFAGLRGGPRLDVLQLSGPKPTLRDVVVASLGLFGGISLINGSLYLYDPQWYMESYNSDVKEFMAAFRQPISWLNLIALPIVFVIGAPVSEELFFRGFLLSGLAKTRWGFWPAAILVTGVWTALHGYSVVGTIGVVTFGLYFSWLLWRSGNNWLPLICHGLANLLALAAIIYIANQ